MRAKSVILYGNKHYICNHKKEVFFPSFQSQLINYMRKGKNMKRKKVLLLAQQKTTKNKKKTTSISAKKKNKKKNPAICAVMVFSLCVKFEGFTVFRVISNYTQYPEVVTRRCTIKKVLLHF